MPFSSCFFNGQLNFFFLIIEAKKEESVSNSSERVEHLVEEAGEESDASNEEFCAAVDCKEPLGDNIKWVQCDGSCDRWFHMVCVGLTKIRKKETYLCESCTESGHGAEKEIKAETLETDVVSVKGEDESKLNDMEIDQC